MYQNNLPQDFNTLPWEYVDTPKKVNRIYHAEQDRALCAVSSAVAIYNALNATDSPAVPYWLRGDLAAFNLRVRRECAEMYNHLIWLLKCAREHFSNAIKGRLFAADEYFDGTLDASHARPVQMLIAERENVGQFIAHLEFAGRWVSDASLTKPIIPDYLFVEPLLATGSKIAFPESCIRAPPVESMDTYVPAC